MDTSRWKRRGYVPIAIFIILLLIGEFEALRPSKLPVLGRPATQDLLLDGDGNLRDRLTTDQCNTHFPDMYKDIDDRVAYWRRRGHKISVADVDINWRNDPNNFGHGGALRVLIHDNRLRITQSIETMIDRKGYGYRALATLSLLQRALDSASAAGETISTIEVAILLEDISEPPTKEGTHSFWTFTSHVEHEWHKRRWLLPNFDFWAAGSTGSFKDAKRRAFEYDAPFVQKIPKAVWRGNFRLNPGVREPLINATRNKAWADVEDVDWADGPSPSRLAVEQFCAFAMTIHTEGITYSGRLTYLLNCNSLLFMHQYTWKTHIHHLFVPDGPNRNYVAFDRGWTWMEEQALYHLANPEEAQRIINNSVATFRSRYLTRAAQSCYLRRMMHSYRDVAFEPEIHRPPQSGGVPKLRGITFEEFLIDPKDFEEAELGL